MHENMTNWTKRKQRRDEVKARAKQPNHMYGYCRVVGCRHKARSGTTDGLDSRYCRSHADRFQRHGSVIKDSYTAAILNPLRRAAVEWLIVNASDPWAQSAVKAVRGLYDRAGPHVEAFRLRGLSPEQRARAAWARLRKDAVDPRLPVAAWIAVEMAIRADLQPDNKPEYRQVQAAKLVHRLASGSHRRWENGYAVLGAKDKGTMRVSKELHVYPKSRGRVLRWIGADLEKAVELLVDHRLEIIETFAGQRIMVSNPITRPHPKRVSVRKRKVSAETQ
jgi:hypothetical protein